MVGEMDLHAVIEQFRSPLIGALSAWGAAPRDAVDLAQDTFAEGYLSRARFHGEWSDSGAVGAWLYGIAKNLYRTAQRKATGRGRLVSLASASEVAEASSEEATGHTDRACTALLEAAQRTLRSSS